jgi:O-antigen/teichoic acid export membrane protein
MSVSAPALSLRHRVIRAGAWTLGGHATSQALRLASNLMMTRLLAPEMFGVMALANVIMVGLQLFSDFGLAQGVVQSSRGKDPVYLNTVWTLQILRGGLLWLLTLGIGIAIHLLAVLNWFPAESVYADPVLPYIIAALSINVLIEGFVSTRIATASRNLTLGRVTLIELIGQGTALACMLAWALWDRSVWALVAGSLVYSLLRVALSHKLLPGERNALHWDQAAFREILGFGKWIFLTSILGFLSANGDRLLLGGLTDSETLGIYAIAFFMVGALRDVFAKLIGSVSFPAFSEVVREQRDALKRTYYRFRLPVDIATLSASGLLFASGHLLIHFLYDDRYHAAGAMIEILCISFFELRYSLAGQCFMALGLPKLLAPTMLIRLIALFGFMPFAFHWWGLQGAVWTIACNGLFTLPLTLYFKTRHGLFDLKRELAVLPLLGVGYAAGLALNHAVSLLGGPA